MAENGFIQEGDIVRLTMPWRVRLVMPCNAPVGNLPDFIEVTYDKLNLKLGVLACDVELVERPMPSCHPCRACRHYSQGDYCGKCNVRDYWEPCQ